MVQVVGGLSQTSVEPVVIGQVQMMYAYAYALFDGVTSASVDISLPRNALVDEFKFLAQAQRVDSTQVQEVAQVRSYSEGGNHEMVIDFGTPRTVSGVDLDADSGAAALNVLMVFSWLGSQFSPIPAYSRAAAGATASAVFPELRTERLRVLLSRKLTEAELANVRLRLPEPPSGLEIRIDDAQPVWSHPEPVQPRANVSAPDAAGWDTNSRRIVDLTAGLAALTGDPLAAEADVTFKVTLSTKVPCRLALAVHGTPQLRRIRRVQVDNDTTAELEFASEGQLDLALPLPAPPAGATRRIDEVRWLAVADLPTQRVLPPLGPPPAATAAEPVLAELLVDAQRAAIVRLPAGSGLAELQAIRLPLRALGDAAEARVVLWAVAEASSMPGQPLPQGASEPVTLTASAAEQWVSFPFKQAVPLGPGPMPWMALVVARGELSWALAQAAAADGLAEQVIRRGPPNGPWRALPAPLQNAAGVLDARGRLRLVGVAPKDAPLAPLTLALAADASGTAATGSAAIALTPTPKGAPGVLVPTSPFNAAQPALNLVSRTAGSVQLREIDIISSH